MILFIYPFGRRFRQLAPQAHTLAEVLHARHGSSSQMIMAISNVVGSGISLMVNFTAAGALVSILSPLTFIQGVLIAGLGVLSYTLWSGFRASVMTDFAQLVAMILSAVGVVITATSFTSSSANDTALGTGARTIMITGIDENYLSQSEVVEMNGGTTVTTTNDWLGVNRVIVLSSLWHFIFLPFISKTIFSRIWL